MATALSIALSMAMAYVSSHSLIEKCMYLDLSQEAQNKTSTRSRLKLELTP